jgi:hypothetical protein
MLSDLTSPTTPVLACTPGAIPRHLRQRWMTTGKQVYAAIEEVQELADGFACRLPMDTETLGKLTDYVSLDRLCCPFVHWTIEIEPNGGPLWLTMKGGDGVKALLRQILETTTLVRESVATAGGLSVSERGTWVLKE